MGQSKHNGTADLDRHLRNYMNAGITKRHILDTLTQYRALRSDQQQFVFNDGSRKDLIKLHGTIPVTFKGKTYHFPICIWLMDTHPNNAPICYVEPTPEMGIRVSAVVDYSGKVYLPYLHEWSAGHSDLLTLIQIMIVTFGEQTPLYKKTQPATNPQYTPAPYMMGMPAQQPAQYYTGSNFPYPPMPTPGSVGGYPHPMGGAAAALPYPSNAGVPVPMPTTDFNSANSGTITEEHIRASLISAVEEKLRRRVQERIAQTTAEIETLQRVKQDLIEGGAKIDEQLQRMEREHREMKSHIGVLQEKCTTIEKSLADMDKLSGDEFNVDEAVTTTAPLFRQLLNAYAEEAATEDATYYLGEALRNGIIDLDVFLKNVRQLARKQFMLRALMQKCRQTAGLAC